MPTGTARGFDFSDSCWLEAYETSSVNSIDDYYYRGAANDILWQSQASWDATSIGVGVVHGVNIDSTSGASNNSLKIGNHVAICGNCGVTGATTYGVYLYGGNVNDTFLWDVETASTNHGIYIDNTGSAATSEDIHLFSDILDNCITDCIYITGTNTSAGNNVTISDGWVSGAITLVNANNVQMSGIQTSGVVSLTNSNNNHLQYVGQGIGQELSLSGSSNNVIDLGTQTGTAVGTTGTLVALTSSSSKNMIRVYGQPSMLDGVSFDSTSNNNTWDFTALSTTYVPNPVVNSGSGNFSIVGTQDVWSGNISLGTSAIASGACAGPSGSGCAVTVAATAAIGVLATDTVKCSLNGSPVGITGYGPSSAGTLSIVPYTSAGYVNILQYNNTLSSITPGTASANCTVQR